MSEYYDGLKEVGSLLSATRVRSKKTQKEIADQIGVSRVIVMKWECHLVLPSLKRSNAVASAYGLDTENFQAILQKAVSQREYMKKALSSLRHEPKKRRKPTLIEIVPPLVFRG